MDINDTNEIVLESREENSNKSGDIEVASTSKPQNDQYRIDISIDDNTEVGSYVDSDEDDPELSSNLKSLKYKYKYKSRESNGAKASDVDVSRINESLKSMQAKYLPRVYKQHSTNKSQSSSRSSRSNVDLQEKRSSKKKDRIAFDNDDGIGSSRKKQSSALSIGGRKNEFESINFSSDEENTKQHSRSKSTGTASDEEELKHFNFSDDEEENTKSTKRSSFIKPDVADFSFSEDEQKSSLNDAEFSNKYRRYKSKKTNVLDYLSDHAEESADEDYVPPLNNHDKEKDFTEESSRRESSNYLGTDVDDEVDEILSRESRSKGVESVNLEDNLPKSVSTEKAFEGILDIDGTSSKIDEPVFEDLDDYVAIDKPAYPPKKKQPRQIIIHEESSNITELQLPFQPGSTTMKNSRRYLAINWLGSIFVVDNNTFHSVTVEYNNKTLHRGYNFRDDLCYSMACLGAHGVLFAAESDTVNPSVLYYKPNKSWAPKSEWMSTFPMGEDIIAIALSDQAIVVATSKNYLRFFTIFGLQNYIFAFPSIVCMAAYSNLLLIAYHLSVAYKGSQNFGYVLYDMRDRGDIQKDVLPISKESTLKWLGFSEEGLPVMFDSKGVLYILHDHRIYKQARWVPVLDTANIVKEPTKSDVNNKSNPPKKNSDIIDIFDDIPILDIEKDEEKENEEKEKEKEKDRIYWPVAVMESKLICFILKYGEDVPRHPRPAYDEVNWQIPLLHLDKESGRYEEKWMRESIISSFQLQEAKENNELNQEKMKQLKKKERSANKMIIELIQMAVSEERYERALELAKLLNSVKFLDSALLIADFYHVTSLAEKINQLKSEKERSISRKKEKEALLNANRKTSSSRPLANTGNSDFNLDYNNLTNQSGSSKHEDTPISSLKRSVKDMNDGGIQEVDDDSPKPKKPAVLISSFFSPPSKKSTLPAKSGDSSMKPFIVDDEKSGVENENTKDGEDNGVEESDIMDIDIEKEAEAIECFD